jgi:anti-sigma B factor antagonist
LKRAMASPMGVTTRQLGRWTVVELSGRVHPGAVSPIRAVFEDLIDSGVTSVLVDLAAVRWIDAVGLAVLIGAHRRLHAQGGELRVSAPSWPIRATLTATGFSLLVPLYDSIAAAEADPAR